MHGRCNVPVGLKFAFIWWATVLGLTTILTTVAILIERREPVIKPVSIQTPIPSIREIQQRLKDIGKPRYDPGKIDGKISLTGKTQTAWNNYICDQYARKSIKGD